MQFADEWQRFEHTGRVEDYLNYLQSTGKEAASAATGERCYAGCRAEERTASCAGEDGSCRNPCM